MAKLGLFLKALRKDCDTTTAAESDLVNVSDYYDTGSLALNRVITGDIHKGIPKGKICTLYGDSQSGKSLIAALTAANALKNGLIDTIFFVDSEGGGTLILESMGVDMNKVEYIPVHSVEKCTVQMLKLYDAFIKMHEEYKADPANNDDIRAIVILDSWGGLSADKLVNDAVNKDLQVQDMGLSAKLKNNLISGLMMRVLESGVTLLVINHTYDNPGAMFTPKIKALPGGKKLEYSSHVIILTTKLLIKSGDDGFMTGDDDLKSDAYYKGNRLNFFCTKNRIVPPCYSANVYVDFKNGIAKYDGLIEDAVKFGFLQDVRGGYSCPTYNEGKKITYKELVGSDEIWNTFIEDFNKKSLEVMSYSGKTDAALDEIEKSMNSEDGVDD